MSTSTGARKERAAQQPPRTRRTLVPTLVVIGAVVLVGVLVAFLVRPGGSAPPPGQALAGAGSATTADVLAALAQDIPEIGTWAADAVGPIVTKDPARNDACRLDVPGDDAAGVAALVAQQRVAGDLPPCLDFARASADLSATPELADAGLTFVPFAVDAVTFTQRAESPNPRSLTVDELRGIYECTAPADVHRPLLPAYGSGLRAAFLVAIGLADGAGFVAQHPCVTEFRAGLSERSGAALADPRDIAPISVAQYLAQSNGVVPDERAAAGLLGRVDGVAPVVADPGAVGLVQRPDSLNSRRLTVENLRAVYTCTLPPVAEANFAPLLPGPGSAVRAAFLAELGVTDSPDFTTVNDCVSDTDAAGTPLPENVGTALTDPRNLAPYSVEQYLAQVDGTVPDAHGTTVLTAVGAGGAQPNASFPLVHDVYTVVPTGRLAEEPLAAVFVGAGSRVCASGATITRHGFGIAANCGDTSLRTPG